MDRDPDRSRDLRRDLRTISGRSPLLQNWKAPPIMPTRLRFVVTLPEIDVRVSGSSEYRMQPLLIALEALTSINEWHLNEAIRSGKPLPRLYESGVYYEEEPPGQEDWLDIHSLYRAGKGDCEDLACALAAERRVYDGIMATPIIKQKFIPSTKLISAGYPQKEIPQDGIFLVHVLSMLPDGTIEDPSAVLGMRGEYS